MRHWSVIRAAKLGTFVVSATFVGVQAFAAAAPDAGALIDAVEQRYNQARTLSVEFSETYTIAGRAHHPENGILLLRKPGRMRWTYSDPAGKLFVTDGENAYMYTAADNRVERSKLKASEDMRAPMAFLLGRLDLKKQFREFEIKPAANGTYLIAQAKNDRLPYEKVRMLIGGQYQIQELTVNGRDGSVLGFVFHNEKVNPTVPEQAFQFTPPLGAEVVDAVSAASGEN